VDQFLETLDLPGTDLAVEGIVDRIGGLARRLRRNLEETLVEFDLTIGDWWTLTALHNAGAPYRRSPGFLAARTELSSGAMTNRLDRLEQRGFVRRLRHPTDRRGVQVELTELGLDTWRGAGAATAERESLVAAALTAREKGRLNDLLRRLMLAFEEQERARGGR
jgi:DNA-binding MarR family transcriptional regulator